MDSMRHLSTSLPRTQRKQDQPDLLSDFKAAALSVTNLYKTAVASQTKVKNLGYQDALDDLLTFLDKENLGLMDGEGWRVRQWATERWNDGVQRHGAGSDEEDEAAVRKQSPYEQRSSSPETQKKTTLPTPSVESKDGALPTKSPVPESAQQSTQVSSIQSSTVPSSDVFTFRSQIHYPTNHERAANPMDLDPASSTTSPPPSTTSDSVRIVSRSHRKRHTNPNRRDNRSTINFNVSGGTGNKRKFPYMDFFDVSGINNEWQDSKDGGKSGKRGRHA